MSTQMLPGSPNRLGARFDGEGTREALLMELIHSRSVRRLEGDVHR